MYVRPWAQRLWRPLRKADRVRFRLNSEGVVVKKKKKDGKGYSVPLAPLSSFALSFNLFGSNVHIDGSVRALRTGGPRLRETQVYPDKFAKEVVKLHTKHTMVGLT